MADTAAPNMSAAALKAVRTWIKEDRERLKGQTDSHSRTDRFMLRRFERVIALAAAGELEGIADQ